MKFEIDPESIRALIEATVLETLAEVGKADDRIAYPEAEAAALLGMATHQLRDRRLEGLVRAKRIGRGYYYGREELLRLVGAK